MAEFLTRIQEKTDTSTNWAQIESTFIPLKGELIIYSDLGRIKIGDGVTTLANLAWPAGIVGPTGSKGNTGNIGIAVCGMLDSRYPINRKQIEACCKKVAELSKKYGISISSKNILTHAEFGNTHPSTTSYGKIDINKLIIGF